jgi:hypothetical protein
VTGTSPPNDFQPRSRLCPARPAEGGAQPRLDVHVIFTSPAATRASLAAASELARELGVKITLMAAQVVPYSLPLENPPVSPAFFERSLLSLAAEHTVETAVEVYLCRDRFETILQVLKPESVVVISDRRRWFWPMRFWPTSEQRLAAALRRSGHRVILLDSKRSGARTPACLAFLLAWRRLLEVLVGRAPWPAADPLVGLVGRRESRTRGSGADEGVRPTFLSAVCDLQPCGAGCHPASDCQSALLVPLVSDPRDVLPSPLEQVEKNLAKARSSACATSSE